MKIAPYQQPSTAGHVGLDVAFVAGVVAIVAAVVRGFFWLVETLAQRVTEKVLKGHQEDEEAHGAALHGIRQDLAELIGTHKALLERGMCPAARLAQRVDSGRLPCELESEKEISEP